MKKDEVAIRQMAECGSVDRESVCRGVVECRRCGCCLIHCRCLADAHVEPGAQTLAGEQLAFFEEPKFTWQ
jgi:hypothetical protein